MRITSLRQFVWVRSKKQFLSRPRQSRSAHLVSSLEEYALAVIAIERYPANVLSIAHSLRLREVHKHILNCACVLTYKLARLTVAVIVLRSTSIVRQVAVFLRQYEFVAKTCKRQLRVARYDISLQLNRAIGVNNPRLSRRKLEVVRPHRLILIVFDEVTTRRLRRPLLMTTNLTSIRGLALYKVEEYLRTIGTLIRHI